VLRTNYRNTAEILAAAMAVAGDEAVDDLGDTFRRRDAVAESERRGNRPALVSCADSGAETAFLVSRIEAITAETAVGLGDIGVFAPTNNAVDELLGQLGQAGLPCQGLDKFDGRPSAHVKVGTYHRAKGLEFKVVFLPGLNAGEFPRPKSAGQDAAEYDETYSLATTQLFVAMTRARDHLYLLCSNDPSEILAGGLDSFDVVDFRVEPDQ
jgi:superfamily I DNA/RNA helicase